MEEVKRKHTT